MAFQFVLDGQYHDISTKLGTEGGRSVQAISRLTRYSSLVALDNSAAIASRLKSKRGVIVAT